MSRRDAQGKPTVASIAVQFTCIPAILASYHTPASRKVLLDLASVQKSTLQDELFGTQRSACLVVLCQAEKVLSTSDLLHLESTCRSPADRQSLLSKFLEQDHPDTVRLFLRDLEDSFSYMDFREHLTPQILCGLKSNLNRASPKARRNIEMLLVLGRKDPVPGLIAMLDNPKWKDKNLALFELARLKDSRAVAPIARILREAPADYFQFDSESETQSESGKTAVPTEPDSLAAGVAIEHALDAIADTESKEAVSELIGLLTVDLGRFGGYIHGEGFRRIIAEHLIELTGESFGVDAKAWRKWNEGNRQQGSGAVAPQTNIPRAVAFSRAEGIIESSKPKATL